MIIWKSVVGYEGLYEVSNSGLIRTVQREYKTGEYGHAQLLPQKLMAFKTDKDGYFYLGLRKDLVRKYKRVSRIVCEAFHENPENKPFANHKNGDKQNNNDWNLEWSTQSENELHSYRVLGKPPNITQLGMVGKLSATSKPLYQYDLNGTLVKEWESLHLAVSAGFTKKSLYQVINGEFSQHKGFVWSR